MEIKNRGFRIKHTKHRFTFFSGKQIFMNFFHLIASDAFNKEKKCCVKIKIRIIYQDGDTHIAKSLHEIAPMT
jgi:hypothetical protein